MHFDALTLACVTHELQETLANGRVQQVLLVDAQSVGLEIYANRQRHYLLLSAQAAASHLYLSPQKLRRGVDEQPPLLLLLRKYVRGSRIDGVLQPDVTERVLEIHCDHPEHGASVLVVELIGRASNLLLLAPGGKILECVRRVWPKENARRTLLPGQPYAAPAPQGKLSPADEAQAGWHDAFGAMAQQPGKLWRQLVDAFAGISPTLGRELAWRMAGDSDAPASAVDPAVACREMAAIWSPVRTGEWTPGLIWAGARPAGFAAYPVHFTGEFEPTDSMSAALARYFAADEPSTAADSADILPPAADPYAARRGSVAALIRDARARVQRQLRALGADEPKPGEAAALRTQAEWLLALSTQIEPEQDAIEIPLDDGPLRIKLDPHKTPVEQAERMFDQAAKMERAAEFIPKRRAKLQADLEYLDQLQVDLSMAEDHAEIVAVQDELRAMGLLGAKTKKAAPKSKAQPRRYVSPDGFAILVGRNARQNDVVTFDIANASDLWLHVRDAPGSHVVVRSGGQTLSPETLQMAAQLAAYFSSLRGERAAPVAATERRFVTRVAGGNPGQVHVRNAETITVPAELPDDAEPPARG